MLSIITGKLAVNDYDDAEDIDSSFASCNSSQWAILRWF